MGRSKSSKAFWALPRVLTASPEDARTCSQGPFVIIGSSFHPLTGQGLISPKPPHGNSIHVPPDEETFDGRISLPFAWSLVYFDSRELPDHSCPYESCKCYNGWGKRILKTYTATPSLASLPHSHLLSCPWPIFSYSLRVCGRQACPSSHSSQERQDQCLSREHSSIPLPLHLWHPYFEASWGSCVGWAITFRLWSRDDSHSCGLLVFTRDTRFQLDFPFLRQLELSRVSIFLLPSQHSPHYPFNTNGL